MDTSKIVTLMRFENIGDAQIAASLLESMGIECSLLHDTISSVLPLHNTFIDIELCVAEEDAERAREILTAKFDNNEFIELTHAKKK